MAITSADPPARLLDLTRLVSRAGRRDTGVDRVERAYLAHLSRADAPLYGLVRTALGYLLLDGAALRVLTDPGDPGPPRLFDRLARRGDPARAALEGALRRRALARARPGRLGAMLARHLLPGTSYINVGHTALTPALRAGLAALPGARVAVMIHDTIPLDHPEYQRPGTIARFRAFLDAAADTADILIANSQATEASLRRHLEFPPEICTAHLGVDVPRRGHLPEGPWRKPYFVALGTIEPRKNHAFLLDLWAEMGEAAPDLLIIGARGWENHATFALLDAGPERVHELGALADAQTFALLEGSAGLLFPSLAEGYGLPPLEALALGVPVVVNTLPVFRELLGNSAVYASVTDRYLWNATILRLARQGDAGSRECDWQPPTWDAHFETVLTVL